MNCYLCEQELPSGGIRYTHIAAIDVCQCCGIGVCARHSRKLAESGSPLLCPNCAIIKDISTTTQSPQVMPG